MPRTTFSLKTLDAAGLKSPAEWMRELAAADAWMEGLHVVDDVPTFDAKADPEVSTTAHLSSDKRFLRTPERRLTRDFRTNPDAYKHITPLPKNRQSLHGVISGRYALWELVPALIEATGQKIADLFLCTLGYSKANAAALLGLLDAGKVQRVSLLISYYFKSTNRPIYDCLVPELLSRGHRVLAMRTHCKIILARTSRGQCYTVESSANLRSGKNVENFCLTRCPKLFKFHKTWIEDELFKPRKREAADVD